jgi:hypothetical protein
LGQFQLQLPTTIAGSDDQCAYGIKDEALVRRVIMGQPIIQAVFQHPKSI